MGIMDDVKKLRDAGKSDDDLVEGLKTFAPEHAGDIEKAQKAGRSNSQILEGVAKFFEPPPRTWADTASDAYHYVADPVRYGLSQAVTGTGATIGVNGADGVGGSIEGIGKNLAPEGYKPAEVHWNDPKSWKEIPRAVLEASPGLASDIAAGEAGAGIGAAAGSVVPGIGTAVGTVVGGGIGAIGSYYVRNFGNDAREAAKARGGDPNAEPGDSDKARALANAAVGGILSRVGFKGAMGEPAVAGSSLGSQLASQAVKGAAVDAATSAGQAVSHDALINGEVLDAQQLGDAAFAGATQGAAIRGVRAVKDVKTAKANADVDPVAAARVANMLRGVNDVSNPTEAYQAVSKVGDDLNVRAKALLSGDTNVKNHLQALRDADASDTTGETLARAQADIKAGRALNPDDLQTLKDTIGEHPHGRQLVETFENQDALNRVLAQGRLDDQAEKFTGGMAAKPFAQKVISPLGSLGRVVPGGAAAINAIPGVSHLVHGAVSPTTAAGAALAQIGAFGGLKALDRVTGRDNPAGAFADRFAGTGGRSIIAGEPSFNELAERARTVQRVAHSAVADALDAHAADAKQAQTRFNDALEAARVTSRLMSNSDNAQQANVNQQLANAKATSRLMEASERANASQAGTDGASGQNSASNQGDTFRVEHRGMTVDRPNQGVDNQPRYAASIVRAMAVRHDAIDHAKAVAKTPEAHRVLDHLHEAMNQKRMTPAMAEREIANAVDHDALQPHADKLYDILLSPKVTATFTR